MPKINVIVADDHPIFRIGLANVIKAAKGLNLLGQAENGRQALELIAQIKPDVAVLDIEMPIVDGLQVCQEVCATPGNATRVIILTLYKEHDLFERAMDVGASGYILKDNAVDDLVIAIESVHAGSKYISQGLSQKLVSKSSHLMGGQKLKAQIEKLTQTERNVILLIAEHKTTREIAKKLFVSEKTVENHRYNIAKKLELVGGQNSLLVFALENALHLR